MSLPIFQTALKDLSLMETSWASQLNPLLANAMNNSLILKSISLATGANVINHTLGRKLQGWIIVRQRASAAVYDTQDSNQTPNLTLQLTASAPVVVDLAVF